MQITFEHAHGETPLMVTCGLRFSAYGKYEPDQEVPEPGWVVESVSVRYPTHNGMHETLPDWAMPKGFLLAAIDEHAITLAENMLSDV